MTGFYNRDGECLLRGTDWIFKYNSGELSCLRRSVVGLQPQKPGFHTGFVRMRFLADKMAMEQVLLPALPFSPVSIIPSMLHTHLHLNTAPIRTVQNPVSEP
jgi:hypothetical protein